jgi:hypothetical protein
MTNFPGSPRLIKGGIVLLNHETSAVERIISLQYNPETLSRTFQIQGAGDGGDRSEALRLTGAPVETIKLEAVIDATDQLEFPGNNQNTVKEGIHPELAALETIIFPKSSDVQENDRLSASGSIEIIPMESPLTLFTWSKNRILPVRLTELSVTEEAFDINLNPIRAKVNIGMRILSYKDLGTGHKGRSIFANYHQAKERLAGLYRGGQTGELGIENII